MPSPLDFDQFNEISRVNTYSARHSYRTAFHKIKIFSMDENECFGIGSILLPRGSDNFSQLKCVYIELVYF